MKGKRRRVWWERVKTLLIVLLSCSAIYLAGWTLFAQQLDALLSRLPQSTPTLDTPATFSGQTLRPAALAVTWGDKRYGLLYHQDNQEVYTQVSALLAEALSDAGAPVQTTAQEWERALSKTGLFCEYLGPMPLLTLSRWLSGQENDALSGLWTRRLCVTEDSLYYQSGGGGYYVCALEPKLTDALATLSANLSPNGARFAGEAEGYDRLRPDSLILPLTPSLPQLLAEDPVALTDLTAPSESLSQLLQVLSFHPQTNPLYAVTGGWAITDGGETLRIDAGGQLTYRRSDSSDIRYPVGDSLFDTTRSLAETTVGALCGSARLYLMEVQQEGSATVVTYGYAYRGAAIRVGREGWCAQFTVENGAVDAFTLRPRHYTALEDAPVILLPQEQAAAALPQAGDDQTLELLYEDSGQSESLIPFWAVQSAGR